MKNLTNQWKLLMAVTIINVIVARGYAIAGIIAPLPILPAPAPPNEASFISLLITT